MTNEMSAQSFLILKPRAEKWIRLCASNNAHIPGRFGSTLGSKSDLWSVDLEHLTKPLALGEADARASECGEGQMDVLTSFLAGGETAEAVKPSQGTLHQPAISSQALADVHAAADNPGQYGAPPAFRAAALMVVSFVGVQLVGPAPRAIRPMPHRWHGIERECEHQAAVPVSATHADPERRRGRLVDHIMALRARFPAIDRGRAGGSAPLLAAMGEVSSTALLQSSFSASARRSRRMQCRRTRAPAMCRSHNRRQHVIPELSISKGSVSQEMPEPRAKIIPAGADRSSIHGRPTFGFAGSGGRNGSIAAHRASETRGLAVPSQCAHPKFCYPLFMDSLIAHHCAPSQNRGSAAYWYYSKLYLGGRFDRRSQESNHTFLQRYQQIWFVGPRV
jgi:hypothetical protein